MRHLVIEYQLEGRRRGYDFSSSTAGFNDDTLKSVWRAAMPRGQGWGAPVFQGARALKSFPLADGRLALSEVMVTGLTDEHGRGGIRRAEVAICQPGEYAELLAARLARLPSLFSGTSERLPRPAGDAQVICTHEYRSPKAWSRVEAVVLLTAHDVLTRGLFGRRFVSFTTLALDYRDESQWVALPTPYAAGAAGVVVLSVER